MTTSIRNITASPQVPEDGSGRAIRTVRRYDEKDGYNQAFRDDDLANLAPSGVSIAPSTGLGQSGLHVTSTGV